jgi:hypothetical protein
MKWRRDSTYVGLRGRTEPNHVKGSGAMYGTGAEVTPLDALQRSILNPPPPSECNYRIQAWKKRGNLKDEQLFEGYSTTAEEGKARCDEWLLERM